MTLRAELEIDRAALESIRAQLMFVQDGSVRGAGRITARAINTVAGRGAKRIKREVTRVMYLRQNELPVDVKKATYGNQYARIRVRDRGFSLTRFNAIQGADGVTARVFKGSPPIFIRSAFIEKSKHGDVVYLRQTKDRKPIDVQRTMSLLNVINERTPGVAAIVGDMSADLSKEIERGIRWELVKAQRAARKTLL